MNPSPSLAHSIAEEPDIHTLPPLSLECIAAQHALRVVDILAHGRAVYDCGACNKEYLGDYRRVTDL